MSETQTPHFEWYDSDGITIVKMLSREIRQPDPAQEFGQQLYALLEQEGRTKLLIDFKKTHYLGSTAFAVLFNLAKKVGEAQGQLKLCSMRPDVRTGADIISLGRYVGIYDDEASALAAF